MKKYIFLFISLTLIILVADGFSQRKQRPCREDHLKFCKDVKGGRGRIHRCLKSHENELTPACKAHIDKIKERRGKGKRNRNAKGFMKNCRSDARTLCKGVKRGQGRIAACLRDNKDKLTPECGAHFK